jgi:tetratricopeptide (TPR) repeat protein
MGTAGVGKTALAVHWAHQIAHRFPDGQLYINLRGFHPRMAPMVPHEAISGFLNALGLAPEQTPEGVDARAGLYRSLVAGRRVLIVLDDAASTEQVRPLLPGTPGCYVIVTSRNRLTGLVAVEAAHPLTLDVLSGTEARELLVHRLGRARVAAEAGAVEAITSQCARLPLALAIVAAHAAIHPNFALSTVSAELSAHRNGVRPLGGSGAETDVRTTFSWSYERLSPAAARLFRLIGLLPGADFGLAAASSLDGRPAGATRSALAELAEAHLITERVPGRFTMHDLLRAYANELAEIIDDGEARHLALRRAVDHYLRSAYRASTLIYPHRYPIALTASAPGVEVIELGDGSAALLWFAEEHPVLLAVLERAASEGLVAHTWQLASALSTFLDRRGHWHDWVSTQHRALASAERGGDLRGQAHAHGSLGLAYNRLKRYDEAHDHLDRGYQLFCELGDVLGQAYIHLRMSLVADGQADMGAALNHAEQALELYRAAGHRIGQGQALNSIGWYRAQMGDFAAAVSRCEQAVSLHRELGDREGVANALDSLGFAHHNLGQFATAIACYQEALDALRGRGDPYYETITLTHMGDTYEAAGDTEAARGVWVESLTILDGLGHPDAHPVRVRLKHLDG